MKEEFIEKNNFDEEKIASENKKEDFSRVFIHVKLFLNNLFDFREDTDHEATIEAIKADIAFKGATAWILIFAVFVASIGLNANSTAVVIGVMLISPYNGPNFRNWNVICFE